jgi:restriction endonuclease S subunit
VKDLYDLPSLAAVLTLVNAIPVAGETVATRPVVFPAAYAVFSAARVTILKNPIIFVFIFNKKLSSTEFLFFYIISQSIVDLFIYLTPAGVEPAT